MKLLPAVSYVSPQYTGVNRLKNGFGLATLALSMVTLLWVITAFSAHAAQDKFSFESPEQRESFLRLTGTTLPNVSKPKHCGQRCHDCSRYAP